MLLGKHRLIRMVPNNLDLPIQHFINQTLHNALWCYHVNILTIYILQYFHRKKWAVLHVDAYVANQYIYIITLNCSTQLRAAENHLK